MSDKPVKAGQPATSTRIPRILEALRRIDVRLRKIGAPRGLKISGPSSRSVEIYKSVLGGIDVADLGIVDISGNSVNVFYELSFMHALGIPVIIIGSEADVEYKAPFYVMTKFVNSLENAEIETIEKALYPDIVDLVHGREPIEVYDNPISDLYDRIPLVDMSASTGLAIGHVYNFIRFALWPGGLLSVKGIKELVIVKPKRVDETTDPNSYLANLFPELQSATHDMPSHPRGKLTYSSIGSMIVDYPTPIMSLQASPRYMRLANSIKNPENESVFEKMQERWIDSYFKTVRSSVLCYVNGGSSRMIFLTAEELRERINSKN